MKGAKRSGKAEKAISSTWVIVDEVTEPVEPLSPGAHAIAKLLEGEDAANELLEITRRASEERPPRKARTAR